MNNSHISINVTFAIQQFSNGSKRMSVSDTSLIPEPLPYRRRQLMSWKRHIAVKSGTHVGAGLLPTKGSLCQLLGLGWRPSGMKLRHASRLEIFLLGSLDMLAASLLPS